MKPIFFFRQLFYFCSAFLLCLIHLSNTKAEEPIEEEYTAFDIYLGDSFKGISAVRFSEDSFTFDNIDDVIGLLPVIDDKTKISPLLEGSIPTERVVEKIGSIKFDSNTFRVVINLDPELLKSKKIENQNEVKQIGAKRAIRQDITVTHLETENPTNAINGLTYVSLGKPWLKGDYFYTDSQGELVREASANMLLGNYKLSAGAIRSNSHRLTPNMDFMGGSLTTSQHNFSENDTVKGSYFQVFIPSKSRVEFFRNSQMIDMQFLDYGLQEIDTSRFPDGSYYVDIVINEFTGVKTTKRQFYTKSGLLAPRGHPLFSLEGGVIRDQLKSLDIPVGVASLDWRILKSAQIEFASFYSTTYQVNTGGLRFLYDGYNLGTTIGIDNENTQSYSVDFSGSLLSLDFGITYERSKFVRFVEDKKNPIPQEFADLLLDLNADKQHEEDTLNDTINYYLSKNFDSVELKFQALKSTQNKKSTYSYGPSLIYSLHQNPTNQWTFQGSYLRSDSDSSVQLLVGYQQFMDQYLYEGNLANRITPKQKNTNIRNVITYDNIDPKSNLGTRAKLQNDTAQNDKDTSSATAMQYEQGMSKVGVLGFGQNIVNKEGASKPTFGVSANSSLILLENGKTIVAPSTLGESLLVVSVNTKSPDVDMEVIVDGNVVSRLKGGGTVVVSVTPFKKYKAAIKPAAKSVLVDYDATEHQFSLYPGDVTQVEFSAEKVFVAMGTIVDVNDKPIKLKRLKGEKVSVLTDNQGFFQTEITGAQVLRIKSAKVNCEVEIPEVGAVDYFHDYGKLTCK